MHDDIESRLRQAAQTLQNTNARRPIENFKVVSSPQHPPRHRKNAHANPISPRRTPSPGRILTQTSSSEQVVQPSHLTTANVSPTQNRHVAKRVWSKLAITAAITILLGAGSYMLFVRSAGPTTSDASPKLPAAITGQISDFVPYFFRSSPQGFTFSAKNVSYSAGVLFFQVQDQAGNTVVISEQALPNDFANSKPQGDRKVSNVDGDGAISNRDSRTIGTLITSKTPRTLININATETVNASAVETLMKKLVPVTDNH